MDFRFTEEEEAFRKEVQAWLKEVIPQRWYDLGPGIWEETEESWAISRTFQKKLGQKCWLAPGYPKHYGGSEMTIGKQLVLSEELARADAPVSVDTAIAVGWVGPTIRLFGNDEQKEKYVKGVASGDMVFCLGYSETEAGSDLAALKTAAIEDGDEYVINGQKIWTSYAHYADYCWLAARTDPNAERKYDGVSMFVVDMKSPGITVRPIINLMERHSFNEVFFDNVRVPKENLVGEKNKGWYELMIALPAAGLQVSRKPSRYWWTSPKRGRSIRIPIYARRLPRSPWQWKCPRSWATGLPGCTARGCTPATRPPYR